MSETTAVDDARFVTIRRAARLWAVAAVHGQADRLAQLHKQIAARYQTGDRLIYLGDFLGIGTAVAETVEELLRFRRLFLAEPIFMHPNDVVFLRGRQEEMWGKLLQLHFAKQPAEVLDWMLSRGVGATLEAYGGRIDDASRAVREGSVSISRWTGTMRERMKAMPGHGDLMSALRRAAYTEDRQLLFVNTGLDPDRPLDAQGDRFWWDSEGFLQIDPSYAGFRRVVRGTDPAAAGPVEGAYTLSLDGGCGRGGGLNAACLSAAGDVLELVQA